MLNKKEKKTEEGQANYSGGGKNSHGKGKGCSKGCGQGWKGKDNRGNKGNADREPIVCYNCGGKGHVKSKCPSKPQHWNSANQAEEKKDKKSEASKDAKPAAPAAQQLQATFIQEVPHSAWLIVNIAHTVSDEAADCFDSGASMHLTADCERLENVQSCNPVTIHTATGKTFVSTNAGEMNRMIPSTTRKMIIRLPNVQYAPELHTTLISIARLADAGINVKFTQMNLTLYNAAGKILGSIPHSGNVYLLRRYSADTPHALSA